MFVIFSAFVSNTRVYTCTSLVLAHERSCVFSERCTGTRVRAAVLRDARAGMSQRYAAMYAEQQFKRTHHSCSPA